MPKKELLDTAKAALMRALEVTERLLDGFPIPGVKGTIGAVLDIIKEAEVWAKIQSHFYCPYRRCRERLPTQNSAKI